VRPLVVERHLTPKQIDQRFRECCQPREKSHWHVIWLLTRPDTQLTAHSAAKLVGVSPAWAAEMVKRWNRHGPDGLIDGRRENGNAPLLAPRQREHLFARLQEPAPGGGLWSGPKVAAYVQQRWGYCINPATGWKWMRRLGFTLQVPRPCHPRAASPAERRGWKKSPEAARAGPAA
jgi:transposase